ncbi:MAG: hypothetical protein JNK46_10225 [Methylobacteriaceae bacterium]|nr:hypothetical protein [Methylobacteriaceae bacterium]
MKVTMVDALLRLARMLATAGSTAARRRAVSTAYYAAFHRLARLCLDQVQGGDAAMTDDERERIYRALEHGSLKSAMQQRDIAAHDRLADLANDIVVLQSARNRADYLPPKKGLFPRQECLDLVVRAETVVSKLEHLETGDRRLLAIHLLFKKRPQ